jgi:RimJ/RimL family protein N-acetyltransferase
MPERHGHGYGTKALKTLIHFGFTELNLNMIWGETVGDNMAQIIFTTCGFEKTGYRPDLYWKDGAFRDSLIFCLRRAKWKLQLASSV